MSATNASSCRADVSHSPVAKATGSASSARSSNARIASSAHEHVSTRPLVCARPRSAVTTARFGSAGPRSAISWSSAAVCGGLGDATTMAAGSIAVRGPLDLAVSRLATPASLRWVMRSLPIGAWPTTDDPWALYDHPSATQDAVAHALAELAGATDYLAGVGIGRGRPIGTPIVEPDVTDDVRARFATVDRSRGDFLVWVAWLAAPPAEWFS